MSNLIPRSPHYWWAMIIWWSAISTAQYFLGSVPLATGSAILAGTADFTRRDPPNRYWTFVVTLILYAVFVAVTLVR